MNLRCIGQKFDHCNDRQAGRHIHIVAAVFFDGTLGTHRSLPAEHRRDLDDDALRGAQSDTFRYLPGQQQSCRACRTQRRTGSGGIATAQKLLTAPDIMLKFGLFGLWFAENSLVLFFAQAVECPDVLRCKSLFRGHHF